MTTSNDFTAVWAPRAQGLLRIVAAFMFMQHGTAKYLGLPNLDFHDIHLFSMLGVAGVLELGGGLLMLLGLFTRQAAFILSGFMAVAYFMAHAPHGFLTPPANGGEAAVLYCFIYLFFFVAGAGAFSLDAIRARKSA